MEIIREYRCGCKVVNKLNFPRSYISIKYCRKHKSAPKMAKLLEYLVTNGWNAGVSEEAQEILAEAEG